MKKQTRYVQIFCPRCFQKNHVIATDTTQIHCQMEQLPSPETPFNFESQLVNCPGAGCHNVMKIAVRNDSMVLTKTGKEKK